MHKPDLQFRVIAHESIEGNVSYFYSVQCLLPGSVNKEWYNENGWHDTMKDLVRNLSRYVEGAKKDFIITTEPIEGVYGTEFEGISGHSNNRLGMTLTRKLNEQEMRILMGNLNTELEDFKRRREQETERYQ